MTLLLSLCSSWVEAAPDRKTVELALSHHESIPNKQVLLGLGPDVQSVLQDIVRHPSHRVLARTRAITVLRLFPSTSTASLLKTVIQRNIKAQKGLALLELRLALASYAVVQGPSSLELIRPYLAHPNMDMRYWAAEAVRLSRSSEAKELLEKRHELEQSPRIRLQLQRQLDLIRRQPPRR
jgi:hypothetical protein